MGQRYVPHLDATIGASRDGLCEHLLWALGRLREQLEGMSRYPVFDVASLVDA